ETSDGVHVPDMILVHVDSAFSRHDVKRSDSNIPKRFDGPAVAPIRPCEPLREVQANLVPLDERTDIDAPSRTPFDFMNGLAQTDARRRSDRRVLLSNQFERLGRPRHQLAVEAHPIGVETFPETISIERATHRSQQLSLERQVLEEATSGARVADAVL